MFIDGRALGSVEGGSIYPYVSIVILIIAIMLYKLCNSTVWSEIWDKSYA